MWQGVTGTSRRTITSRSLLRPPRQRTPTVTKPSRTPAEQRLLDSFAKERGQEYVDRHAELILDQARAFGDL